jgi:hypothetical protein
LQKYKFRLSACIIGSGDARAGSAGYVLSLSHRRFLGGSFAMPGSFGTSDKDNGAFASTKATDKVGVFGSNEATTPPSGGGAGGAGVFGLSVSPGAAGVFGSNNSGQGVGVQGNGPEAGVSGFSQNATDVRGVTQSSANFGVFGSNNSSAAPTGGGAGGAGVFGLSVSPGAAGVFGSNNSGQGVGVQGNGPDVGVRGFSDKHVGVRGDGLERGVSGFSQNGAGVVGQSTAANGVLATSTNGQGVTAFSDNDIGLFAQGGTFGAVFKGALVVGKGPGPKDSNIKRNQVDGSIVINDGGSLFLNGGGDIILGNADCAEDFDIANANLVEVGTVRSSQFAYDKRVAGVVSGAGNYKPGIVLDKQGSQPNRKPIALLGKVYCKVDASYAPVEIGDLLTTSPTPGHGMKATDQLKAFGAVIGKALRPLETGQGLIPILIALQ